MATNADRRPSDSCYVVTRCTVCSELYNDPLLLPCLHTFCAKCLRGCSTGNDAELVTAAATLSAESDTMNNRIVCPLCLAPFCGEVESLPANTFIAKVTRVRRLEVERRTKQVTCSACSRHTREESVSLSKSGVVYCVDCDDTLCKACSDAHRKLKLTEPHHLVELSDSNFTDKIENILKSLSPPCQLHINQPRTLYCREAGCMTPICAHCAVSTHRTHDFVDITEVTASHRETLQSSLGTTATVLERVTSDCEQVRSAIHRLDDSLKQTEQDIADRAAELNEVVSERHQELQEIVNYVHLDQTNKVGRVEDEVRREKEITENVMAVCRELATRGSDVEVCNLAKRCITRANQLLNAPGIQLQNPVRLTFVPSSDLETFKCQPEKLLGTVDTLNEATVMSSAENS